MPGQPVFAALEQRLAKAGDEVFHLIADGRSMREVATHFGSSRTQLCRCIATDEDRKAALRARSAVRSRLACGRRPRGVGCGDNASRSTDRPRACRVAQVDG